MGVAATSFAQAGITAPRLTDIHYDVIFTAATAARRQVAAEMRFSVEGDAPVILSLPAWTPGSYSINNFARNVSSFAAEQAGAPLRWDKTDHDSWRVFPRTTGPVRIRFEYKADSLENE